MSVQQWTGVGGKRDAVGEATGGTAKGTRGGGAEEGSLVPVSVWLMVQNNRAANASVWGESGVVNW